MLYEIIAILLALYAISTPFWMMKAVKFGISVAEEPEKAAEEPIFNLPEKKEEPQPVVLTEEQQKYVDILENLEVFDGTSQGQKEIKG